MTRYHFFQKLKDIQSKNELYDGEMGEHFKINFLWLLTLKTNIAQRLDFLQEKAILKYQMKMKL